MQVVAVLVVSSLVKTSLNALKESLRLQGARGLHLRRATSGEMPLYQVPELKLNFCMISELFVQILATGLGVLIFVWATVVLLGGFSTLIPKEDFWVITGIVFIQAARVVGLNVSPEAQFFNQVPPAFLVLGSEHYTTWGRNIFIYILMLITSFQGWVLIIMAFLAILVLAVKLVAGGVCISLSIYRLIALSSRLAALSRRHDNAFVFHALILLYALVLLQGALIIIWLNLWLYRSDLANRLCSEYGLEDNREVIDKYMDKTLSTAIKNGLYSSIIKWNLASFAADLIKSDYSHDHIDAVLVIHTLTSQEEHRARTLSQIRSSPLCVSRLLDMVSSKSRTDHKTKICIAEIVAHLASNLRLADISGATESISCMIDPCLTMITTPDTDVNIGHQTSIGITIEQQGTLQSASASNGAENIRLCISIKQLLERGLAWWRNTAAEIIRIIQHVIICSPRNTSGAEQGPLPSSSATSGAESRPLIIHGLLILAKLAVNPDNCKQIYDSKSLFSKIISPVKNKVYEIPSHDGIHMEIAEKALEVVTMLVSGTNETNGKIRRDICSNRTALNDICSNGIAMNDIRPILGMDHMYNKLKVPATKILTELYLDMSTRATIGLDDIAVFIEVLLNIFFDAANESGLRKTAGKALARLAMDNANNCMTIMNFNTGTETSVVQLLTAMIPRANNRLYPTDIVQVLMQLCVNSNSNAERERLESVKTVLHEVLKVICNVEEAANANPAGPPQHNLGQQQGENTNQLGPPEHNVGQQQAPNANQAGSPQHNPGQPPLLSQALHRLNSVLRPRRSHAADRNAPGDNLPTVAQLVGGRRKSLAAFLGLGLQICEKLNVGTNEFDTALARIPLSMGEFMDKLNDIIEQCKGHSVHSSEGEAPSLDYLVIVKTVTKLCTWMMHSKPDCITEFQNKNTSTKLQGALDMRELELGMLLTCSAGDMASYETLSAIVATARQKMDANVGG